MVSMPEVARSGYLDYLLISHPYFVVGRRSKSENGYCPKLTVFCPVANSSVVFKSCS